ncbi:MAG: hypothetical protein IPO77_21910 [Acidobacteria bacterium]|nr:hypothetical protein [Acidobacteriota bacterium]
MSNIRVTDVLLSGLETPPGRVLGVRSISVNPELPSREPPHLCGADRRQPVEQPAGQRWFPSSVPLRCSRPMR